MHKRITLISSLDQTELRKIYKQMSDVKTKTCKVPYGIDDENRYSIDTLPYHFTIFATNKENQTDLIDLIKTVSMNKIRLKVNKVEIMNGKNNSYVLYFGIEDNSNIKELQRICYYKFPSEHYNPNTFIFHMTLHIDKDYETIKEMQRKILKHFKPFYLKFNEIALFDYPGEEIEKFTLN